MDRRHEERGRLAEGLLLVRPEAEIDPAGLPAWCRARLAAYKVPARFEFVNRYADDPRFPMELQGN